MPLQNRMDPFGAIHAVSERGLFTGNRGVIHDSETKTLLKRRWTTKAWLICACAFGNRRREPMGRNHRVADGSMTAGWTELFFLDEVTALAAGHRPCFFCRRQQARDFLGRFGAACGVADPRVAALDARLHRERLASGGKPVAIAGSDLATLPDGAMFTDGQQAYAVRDGRALRWSFEGYEMGVALNDFLDRDYRLLTPKTALAVLQAGYPVTWST